MAETKKEKEIKIIDLLSIYENVDIDTIDTYKFEQIIKEVRRLRLDTRKIKKKPDPLTKLLNNITVPTAHEYVKKLKHTQEGKEI